MFDISKYLGLPPVGSAHAAELDYMLGLVHWLMLILFVIWTPFFIYVLFRFRKSKNPKANYHGTKSKLSTYQEVAVVVAELVLLFAFAIPSWATIKNDFPKESESVVVHCIGEQFAWNFVYPGPDGVFGKRAPENIDTQLNPAGLDLDDPNGKDDIVTINELYLPVDKPAIVHISSKDVIHSFALNRMRVKQDAIPGITIPVYFTPIQIADSDIGCAQLCGLGHYRMRGILKIRSQEDYDEWMQGALDELREYGR